MRIERRNDRNDREREGGREPAHARMHEERAREKGVGKKDTQAHKYTHLGADSLCDVAESVDGRAANRLLVGLEQVQESEADANPLLRGDILGTTIGNAAHKVNAVLLHLLVSGMCVCVCVCACVCE